MKTVNQVKNEQTLNTKQRKTLKKNLPEEDISSSAESAEQSILKKIKNK